MAALAALSGAALASDSVLRGASDVIDKRVIPRVVNSLATRLGDARLGVRVVHYYSSSRCAGVESGTKVTKTLPRNLLSENSLAS